MRFCRTEEGLVWVWCHLMWLTVCLQECHNQVYNQSLSIHSACYKLQSNLHFKYKMCPCRFPLPFLRHHRLGTDNRSLRPAESQKSIKGTKCRPQWTAKEYLQLASKARPQVGNSYHGVNNLDGGQIGK